DGDDLMILLAHIAHVQHAEHTRVHQATGKDGLFGQDQHVERIAVRGKRARNEPVMGWIVDRGVQDTIEPDAAALLVVLVLVAAAYRNLDERFDDVCGVHLALLYKLARQAHLLERWPSGLKPARLNLLQRLQSRFDSR